MPDITYNLRKLRDEIVKIRHDLGKIAYMEVVPQYKPHAHRILAENAETAAMNSVEYNLPMFITPLKKACLMDDSIAFIVLEEGDLGVYINLDRTAGSMSEYASAVAQARETFPKSKDGKERTPNQKSAYWAWYIYEAARGGADPMDKKDSEDEAVETGLYWTTMKTRFDFFRSLAPFWELIDQGSLVMAGSGGWAHPEVEAQFFTSRARDEIRGEILHEYYEAFEDIYLQLDEQQFGGAMLLDTIDEYINLFESDYVDPTWTPGTILEEMRIKGRSYDLYITRTGMLGMALAGRGSV